MGQYLLHDITAGFRWIDERNHRKRSNRCQNDIQEEFKMEFFKYRLKNVIADALCLCKNDYLIMHLRKKLKAKFKSVKDNAGSPQFVNKIQSIQFIFVHVDLHF